MFGKIKIDPNDKLYSQIIRFGRKRCMRCDQVRELQAAHIVGRAHYATRFMLKPVRNAVALCMACHNWFDTSKMKSVIFEPSKRVFNASEEGFTFLNVMCGYSWNDLEKLFILSRQVCSYSKDKPIYHIIKKDLTEELKRLEIIQHK